MPTLIPIAYLCFLQLAQNVVKILLKHKYRVFFDEKPISKPYAIAKDIA
jgi:hypothetical protein